jgi:histidinol-phosphatase (PHP family)
MSPEELPSYLGLVREAASEWAGRQEILVGLESDYVPGMEAWLREVHAKAEFHHILGSVHPQIREYRERYFSGDPLDYQQIYFRHLAEAAETGLFDTLSHPDLIKNETADSWNLDVIMPAIRESLDRIAASGCAMELNTSGLLKRIPEMNPGPEILAEILARGIPVVIGSDAHIPSRAGDRYVEALEMLLAIGFTQVSGFRERQRFEVPIEVALASLSGLQGAGRNP